MDFRRKNGSLDHSKVEVWMEGNSVPEIGVLEIDGDNCYFHSYNDAAADGSPLYLFSFVDEHILQDMKNGRVDLLTGFNHHSALVFQEVEEDGKITAKEVDFSELNDDLLPQADTFLM